MKIFCKILIFSILFFSIPGVVFPALASLPVEGPVVIVNEIPYGNRGGGLVARGSVVTALLQVESRSNRPISIEYELRIPQNLTVKKVPDGMKMEESGAFRVLRTRFELTTAYDKWYRTVEIEFSAGMKEGLYEIQTAVHVVGAGGSISECLKTDLLNVVAKERISEYVTVREVRIPVNEWGEDEERQRKNIILMTGGEGLFHSIFLPDTRQKEHEPAAYAGVVVENRASSNAVVLVTLKIVDPETGAPVPGFDPLLPPGHGGLSLKGIYQVVRVEPKETQTVVLPIYAEEGVTLPGDYLAQFDVRHFGTNTLFDRKEIGVKVVARRWLPVFVTILALSASLLTLLGLYLKRKTLMEIKTKDLITVALFAACIFAAVSLPGTFLWQFAHGVLGPFSFLITGFFYEILYYTLLVALVVLIPKPGVATLTIVLKTLMTDIIFGGFSPLSMLNVGATVVCTEAAFYVSGVTRGNSPLGAKQILMVAVACGLSDVIISMVSFNIIMFLYRLYYDFWYLVLYLLIGGFLYTAVAVPFGVRLGLRLKGIG